MCVIGAGKMGSIIARSLLKTERYRVVVTDIDPNRRTLLKSYGARVFEDNRDAVRDSDIIILAVKPKDIFSVLNDIKGSIGKKLVVSIAAAVPLSYMEKVVPEARFIRIMPNILIEVGEAFIAICPGSKATEEDVELVSSIFGNMGEVVRVEENMMDGITGLSGSGPAYIFTIMDALVEGGVKIGLPKELALRMVVRTMFGSAKMVLEGKGKPAELRDMVVTPGGTTMAGLHELEKGGIRMALMNAVEAATRRAEELAAEFT